MNLLTALGFLAALQGAVWMQILRVHMFSLFLTGYVGANMPFIFSQKKCIQFNIEHACSGSYPQEGVSMVGGTTVQYMGLPIQGFDGKNIYPSSRILLCAASVKFTV